MYVAPVPAPFGDQDPPCCLDGAGFTGEVGDAGMVGQPQRTQGLGEYGRVGSRGITTLDLCQRSGKGKVIGSGSALDHSMDLRGGGQVPQHRGKRDRRCFFTGEHVVGRVMAYDEVSLRPGHPDLVPD